MTREETRERLEEIKKDVKWSSERDPLAYGDLDWLITQLEAAWKREEIAREALEFYSQKSECFAVASGGDGVHGTSVRVVYKEGNWERGVIVDTGEKAREALKKIEGVD